MAAGALGEELRTARELRLRDGRVLAFAEHGDPAGRPLFFFHGFPGSRVEAGMVREEARRAGVRIVAPDRPGMGRSSAAPGRALSDWASDVAELADALGLERFPVVGASGGGPYAIACAARIPERLTAVGVACGLAPIDDPRLLRGMLHWNRIGLRAGRRMPWLARPVLGALAPAMRRFPAAVVRRLAGELPPPDRDVLADPELRALLAASFRESFRAGAAGPASDARIYARPWDVDLGAIPIEVRVWHGERDAIVPVAMGRHLHARLRDCRATFFPEEGHFSLVVRRCRELFEQLLS